MVFCTLYLLGNGIILFNQGIYWDDWTVFNASKDALLQQFWGNGSPHWAYLHWYLQKFSNPKLIYNILTFFLQIGSIFLLFQIVKNLNLKNELFYLVILFSGIIPYFSAKNTMICFIYTSSYFLFILGCYFMLMPNTKYKFIKRLLSIIFLVLSFSTESFLVFFTIPFVIYAINNKIIILREKNLSFKSLKNISINLKKDIYFYIYLILPFLTFVLKLIYFPTTNLHARFGYNEITLEGLLLTPENLLKSFLLSFIGLFNEFYDSIFNGTKSNFLLLVFLFFMTLFVVVTLNSFNINKFVLSITKPFRYFLLSFSVFMLAALPYCIIGKVPQFGAYYTRHQLLLPIGSAMLLLGIIYLLSGNKKIKQKVWVLIFTSLCVATTFVKNLEYISGGLKNEALIMKMKNDELFMNNTTFLVFDKAIELNATSRGNCFYAFNGMAKMAFGNENRLICDVNEYLGYLYHDRHNWSMWLSGAEMLNMKDYDFEKPRHLIVLDSEVKKLSTTLQTLFYKFFANEEYKEQLKKYVEMKVVEINFDEIELLLEDK